MDMVIALAVGFIFRFGHEYFIALAVYVASLIFVKASFALVKYIVKNRISRKLKKATKELVTHINIDFEKRDENRYIDKDGLIRFKENVNE